MCLTVVDSIFDFTRERNLSSIQLFKIEDMYILLSVCEIERDYANEGRVGVDEGYCTLVIATNSYVNPT